MINGARLASAIAFYTCLPIPSAWAFDFQFVSRYAPFVGVGIGALLGGFDVGLAWLGLPLLTRSALIVALWIGITGGLHLDGAMDAADGLAVTDPDRRLQVMADSVTGAFGAMVAVIIILLKTVALAEIEHNRWLVLLLAAGWGRWAQQIAIVRYPYLKPTGKGAFHKQALVSVWDTVPSLLLLLAFSLIPIGLTFFSPQSVPLSKLLLGLPLLGLPLLGLPLLGLPIALLVPAWFNHQLGGHTGDTYGAVVEWTEAFFLVAMTILGMTILGRAGVSV
jgi:adenosylcobinamide-GDP ribazoletransferase